jgi:PqqD family protein of HPr-rel-A system
VAIETAGMAPNVRWRAASDLVWTHYEDADDWAVYSPASGDIHLLTPSARRLVLLAAAAAHTLTIAELGAQLATELERPLDDELLGIIRDALTALDQAGVMRPSGP